MQEAATMARIAAELHRLVDDQSQQVCIELSKLKLQSDPETLFRPLLACVCADMQMTESYAVQWQAMPWLFSHVLKCRCPEGS